MCKQVKLDTIHTEEKKIGLYSVLKTNFTLQFSFVHVCMAIEGLNL